MPWCCKTGPKSIRRLERRSEQGSWSLGDFVWRAIEHGCVAGSAMTQGAGVAVRKTRGFPGGKRTAHPRHIIQIRTNKKD